MGTLLHNVVMSQRVWKIHVLLHWTFTFYIIMSHIRQTWTVNMILYWEVKSVYYYAWRKQEMCQYFEGETVWDMGNWKINK